MASPITPAPMTATSQSAIDALSSHAAGSAPFAGHAACEGDNPEGIARKYVGFPIVPAPDRGHGPCSNLCRGVFAWKSIGPRLEPSQSSALLRRGGGAYARS